MKTYYIYLTAYLSDVPTEKNEVVESDLTGRDLLDQIYREMQAHFPIGTPIIIKNIVCLTDSIPSGSTHEEVLHSHNDKPVEVVFTSRPDIRLKLKLSGTYLDKLDVTICDCTTRHDNLYCLELPAKLN